jgi:hypothetical protein
MKSTATLVKFQASLGAFFAFATFATFDELRVVSLRRPVRVPRELGAGRRFAMSPALGTVSLF